MSVEHYLMARFLASSHASSPATVAVHVNNLRGPPLYYQSVTPGHQAQQEAREAARRRRRRRRSQRSSSVTSSVLKVEPGAG